MLNGIKWTCLLTKFDANFLSVKSTEWMIHWWFSQSRNSLDVQFPLKHTNRFQLYCTVFTRNPVCVSCYKQHVWFLEFECSTEVLVTTVCQQSWSASMFQNQSADKFSPGHKHIKFRKHKKERVADQSNSPEMASGYCCLLWVDRQFFSSSERCARSVWTTRRTAFGKMAKGFVTYQEASTTAGSQGSTGRTGYWRCTWQDWMPSRRRFTSRHSHCPKEPLRSCHEDLLNFSTNESKVLFALQNRIILSFFFFFFRKLASFGKSKNI